MMNDNEISRIAFVDSDRLEWLNGRDWAIRIVPMQPNLGKLSELKEDMAHRGWTYWQSSWSVPVGSGKTPPQPMTRVFVFRKPADPDAENRPQLERRDNI